MKTAADASMAIVLEVFGSFGPKLRHAGFAVLPAEGKRPLMAGFTNWQRAPGTKAVDKWAAEHPNADVVYVPGLSRTKRGEAIVVVDGDDEDARGRILELFGHTPGKVRTRRGWHFMYRDNGARFGKVQSLKAYGLNADVKHGRSIVVAPPSRHEKDRSFVYSWDGCDETVIGHLPAFNTVALSALMESSRSPGLKIQPDLSLNPGREIRPNVTDTAPPPAPPLSCELLHQGSRGLGLNRWLCSQVRSCNNFDALLDRARAHNRNLVSKGHEPIDDIELIARATAVWKDLEAGKLERWSNTRAVARTDAREVKDLCTRDHGGDAVALLMLLRAEHQARVLRGETFALNVKAMVERDTLAWTAERFRKAIKVLLEANYLERVVESSNSSQGRVAAQYTLVTRQLVAFENPEQMTNA